MAYDCLGYTYLVAEEWERALAAFDEQERLMGSVEDPYGRNWLLHGRAEAELGAGARTKRSAWFARRSAWPSSAVGRIPNPGRFSRSLARCGAPTVELPKPRSQPLLRVSKRSSTRPE